MINLKNEIVETFTVFAYVFVLFPCSAAIEDLIVLCSSVSPLTFTSKTYTRYRICNTNHGNCFM